MIQVTNSKQADIRDPWVTVDDVKNLLPPYGVARGPVYDENDYAKDHEGVDPSTLETFAVRKVLRAHTDDAANGISLIEDEDGNILVERKTKTNLSDMFHPFDTADIKEGDRIKGINGKTEFCCLGDAEKTLRDEVRLAAKKHGYKLREGCTAGISLGTDSDGNIVVESIQRHSPFFVTRLDAGDRIYAINGVSDLCCTGEAEKLIREADEIAIITDKKEVTPVPTGWH